MRTRRLVPLVVVTAMLGLALGFALALALGCGRPAEPAASALMSAPLMPAAGPPPAPAASVDARGVTTIPWSDFSSAKGGFVISMPGTPTEDTLARDGVESHVFEVEAAEGAITFTVTYTDYDAEMPATQNVETLLDLQSHMVLAGSGGTLVFERHTRRGDLMGRELRVRDAVRTTEIRLFARRTRVFEASVSARQGEAWPEVDTNQFFDSFRIDSTSPSAATPAAAH